MSVRLSVRPSAAFVYCAKTVVDSAMKFGSIRELHAGIPDSLSLLGYDDNKGSKWGNPKMVALKIVIFFVIAQTQYKRSVVFIRLARSIGVAICFFVYRN